jgi:hypothetical protein
MRLAIEEMSTLLLAARLSFLLPVAKKCTVLSNVESKNTK